MLVDGSVISDLREADLKPGDTITIECADKLSAEQRDVVRRHLRRLAPSNEIDVVDNCVPLYFLAPPN